MNFDALAARMKAKSPRARIDKLREAVPDRADELATWLDALDGKATAVLLLAITTAEDEALRADVAPKVARDAKRQAGTQKPRRPAINEWIAKQLERDPDAKSPSLWRAAPEWITDQIGLHRFRRRVSDVRKTMQ